MKPDAEIIRAIVAEVLARIAPAAGAPATPAAPGSAPPPLRPAAAAGAGGVALADKVVTLASLQRLPAGTTRVAVAVSAVVTPAAREWAHDTRIEIVRGLDGASPAPAAVRPFILAHAACNAPAAGRCAALMRTIPGAQQLPATGLSDVVAALAMHASRDGARGLLLTGRPATAVVLANRSTGLRAVTAADVAGLLAAASACAANLIIVDPGTFSPGGLERACLEFVRRDLGPIPAELAHAPHPCGCQAAAH